MGETKQLENNYRRGIEMKRKTDWHLLTFCPSTSLFNRERKQPF